MQNGLNLSSPKATFSPLADLSWATTENIFGIIDLRMSLELQYELQIF